MTVRVDRRTSQDLNAGREVCQYSSNAFVLLTHTLYLQVLQDLIILRIEKSFDYYIKVKANFIRSCYGMSIEELVNTLLPVSMTPLPSAQTTSFVNVQGVGNESDSPLDTERSGSTENNTAYRKNNAHISNKLSVPKELWRLVDALWIGNALLERDLFACEGNEVEVTS